MTPAIVIVLPVPVAPSSVVKRSPARTASEICVIAFGWSAAGVKMSSSLNCGTTEHDSAGLGHPLTAIRGRIRRSCRLWGRMNPKFDTTARLAGRQHGRISWAQLVEAGVDAEQIKRWVRDGRLRAGHHGVYAVGHVASSVDGDYMAAVLACGEGAVLSQRAAAYRLRLLRGAPPPPEVTVPTTAGRRRPGIVVHRVRALHPLDVSTLDGIPITTVPRILLDLAPRAQPEQLTRMCHEAWVLHGTGPPEIDACIARNPHKKGAAKLRRAQGADVTLSDLESRFLTLLEDHGLPLPRTNIDVRGDKVDCHWPDHGLTVELHSYRHHATRHAFEQDLARRRRSNHVAYSYGDVFERGVQTIADLRPRLATGGGRSSPCAGPSGAAAGCS